MGDSPLAQRLALDLGAVRVPSIGMGDSITDLTTALDQDQESVKVVFVDYLSETGPWGLNPGEIRERLLLAVEKVRGRCGELGHRHFPCELIFFKPLSCPANYVASGEPSDIHPDNDHTSWYDELDAILWELGQQTSGSYAFPLNNPVRSLSFKGKHKWSSWAEFNSDIPATKTECAILTDEAMDKLVATCVKHIRAFTTVWNWHAPS